MEKQTNAPSRGSLRPHLLLMLEAKRSRSDRTTDRRSAVMKKWLSATEIQMKWRWCCRLSWCRSSHQPHVRRNTLPPCQLLSGSLFIFNKRLSVWKHSHYRKQKVIWWRHHRVRERLGYKERHLTDKSILCLRSAVKLSMVCFFLV